MARIFITGSADGLGLFAARRLIASGHEVVLHGRHARRAQEALKQAPGAAGAVHGDLADLDEVRALAAQVNALGTFDAVIHNAGMGDNERQRGAAAALPRVFAVNTLAPYVLTALVQPPRRLVYLSSRLHRHGDASLRDLEWKTRPWDGLQAYSDTKFHDVLLAFAIARRWSGVHSNAVEPGWVPTKMGGASATDDLDQGSETQAWLAAGEDPGAQVTGEYLYHLRPHTVLPAARDISVQGRLMEACSRLSGVALPEAP